MGFTKNFFIDKSNWIKVKFGDVVFEPKESIKDPVAEGIVHVVGLEHIDSGDIHLRHSAGIEEGTTFTKKFIQEDVVPVDLPSSSLVIPSHLDVRPDFIDHVVSP